MSLPSGIITFLFTDIEGSTRLWQDHSDGMRLALTRHDTVLRQTIEAHGGHVFKTVGDAFCAAFRVPAPALAAAQAAQQALAPVTIAEAPVRVRMALHVGEAEAREEDYYGATLNRAARLLLIAHGGQTLLSQAAYEALQGDVLPSGVVLRDMASHRLKDLAQPEHVWQLVHPDLPDDFPPLRSLQAFANNLPQQMTSFVGRQPEMEEVKEMLSRYRLVTLTGTGGCGKTRLSLQVAAEILETYGDGVWQTELAALSDPALVPQALASALGLREEPGRALTETLTDHLRSKSLLLLLDNCEHLIQACADLAQTLLQSCVKLQILATSREPLAVPGEKTWRVPALAVPESADLPPDEKDIAAVLLDFDAPRLFVERARLHSNFALNRGNVAAVAQICSRLDGIPLAIELAAARARSLSVEEINARLDNRFRLLTGGSRTALPRQQTLRALIDWSYDLLQEQEKTVLQRLSVFAGGWTLAAAEAVCAGEGVEEWETLDRLTGLADKSLAAAETEQGSTRYRLLETVRWYGADRLAESGGEAATRQRHAAWFMALTEQAALLLRGPEQGAWLERLEMEHDNLRAALAWFEQQPDGAEAGMRLAGALWRFWKMHGHVSEGRQWLHRALARDAEAEASLARARALHAAGLLASDQGEYALARNFLEEGLTLRRQLGDQNGIADSLNSLGAMAYYQSEYAAARPLWEESLMLQRQLGDQWGMADSLNNLGVMACRQGENAAAQVWLEEGLALRRQFGDHRGVANSLHNLGNVARSQGEIALARGLFEESLTLVRELGDQPSMAGSLLNLGNLVTELGEYALARILLEESLALNRQLGDQQGVGMSLNNLGALACAQGDYTSARASLVESLTLLQQVGDPLGVAYGLEDMAGVAQGRNQPQRAAELLGAADALRESISAPLDADERKNINQWLSAARALLGADAFAEAWNSGRVMTQSEAIEYALEEKPAILP